MARFDAPERLRHLADVDLTTVEPADGDAFVYDAATGTWVPGFGGADPNEPLDELTMRAPDGSLWTFAVDNTGAWPATGTALDARVTTDGDLRVTTDGSIRATE